MRTDGYIDMIEYKQGDILKSEAEANSLHVIIYEPFDN